MLLPPFTLMTCPVMNAAASEGYSLNRVLLALELRLLPWYARTA